MTWQSVVVCEGCVGKVTYKGPEKNWMPPEWVQAGMSKLPTRVGKIAMWCPSCKNRYLRPKTILESFFVEERPMEAKISGTVNFEVAKEPPAHSPQKAPIRPTLRESIQKMSAAAQALLDSGLNQDAVIVLLHDRCGVTKNGKRFSKTDIANVLKHLRELEKNYCR